MNVIPRRRQPSVTACPGCDCAVAATPELDDQLERRVRYYQTASICKSLTEVFPDRDDWERAILIDDDNSYVGDNLGHGINAFCNHGDFGYGLLNCILPIVEKCVEVTREHRQRLGAKLEERRSAGMKQEQEELAAYASNSEEQGKLTERLHSSALEGEILIYEDKHKRVDPSPPRWSEFFQARVASRCLKPYYYSDEPRVFKMPAPRANDKGKGKALNESVYDLWSTDPVCKAIILGQHGEEGYKTLLATAQQNIATMDPKEASELLQMQKFCDGPKMVAEEVQAIPDSFYDEQIKVDKTDFWINKDA